MGGVKPKPPKAVPSSNPPQDPAQINATKQRWLKEQLLAPPLAQVLQETKEVFTYNPQNLFPSEDYLVLSWLHNGSDFDELAELINEHPSMHKHFLISEQLQHLQNLAEGFMPFSDFGQGVMDLKQQEAKKLLQRLITAWAEGMLPDSQVTITPKNSPGRKRDYDRLNLLCTYKELLQGVWFRLQLKPKKDDENWLRRREDESIDSFSIRIGKYAQNLYQSYSLSTTIYLDPQEPFLKSTGEPNTVYSKKHLTPEQESKLARLSIRKSDKSISITTLLYGLLALHYRGEISQQSVREIEKTINRAQGDYPVHHRTLQYYIQKIREALP